MLLDVLKKEAVEAGVRIGCAQAVRAVRGALGAVFTSDRAQSFLNSKVGSGILTTAVGLGLGRANHNLAQTIGRECRVQGITNAGNGLVEQVTSKEEHEDEQQQG